MRALLLFLCLFSWVALAQEPPTDAEKAQEAFSQAELYYKAQEYQKALSFYKDAYILSKEPALLFNMGQCYRLLGKKEEALRSYRNYLKDTPPDDPNRPEVENLITQVENQSSKSTNDNAPTMMTLPLTQTKPDNTLLRKYYRAPLLLGAAGALCGAGAVGFKIFANAKGEIPASRKSIGLGLAAASDILLISAGVTFLWKRQKAHLEVSVTPTLGPVITMPTNALERP